MSLILISHMHIEKQKAKGEYRAPMSLKRAASGNLAGYLRHAGRRLLNFVFEGALLQHQAPVIPVRVNLVRRLPSTAHNTPTDNWRDATDH